MPNTNITLWLEETAARACSARDYESAAEILLLANAHRLFNGAEVTD